MVARMSLVAFVFTFGLLVIAPAPARADRGYQSKACSFDLNRNGVIGEPADCKVCDGTTTDVDGNGVTDKQMYVDCQGGNDSSGDGSAFRPFKTIQKGLDSLPNPAANQIQAVCFKGTCSEKNLVPAQSGAPGVYTRPATGSQERNFEFPSYPMMLVGWDANGNHRYPPNDTADVAVLDGTGLGRAITNTFIPRSRLEFAHFSAKKYGMSTNAGGSGGPGGSGAPDYGSGFMSVSKNAANRTISHIYVHDIELSDINRNREQLTNHIIFDVFLSDQSAGPLNYFAVWNLSCRDCGAYFSRGSGWQNSDYGPYRFQNLTFTGHGCSDGVCNETPNDGENQASVEGWKYWDFVNGVEILDNDFDVNTAAWTPGSTGCCGRVYSTVFVNPAQCSRGWTIRNNRMVDFKVGLNVSPANSACTARTIDTVTFDRNTYRNTFGAYSGGDNMILMGYEGGSQSTQTVENVTISNNFLSSTVGTEDCIWSNVGYNGSCSRHPGSVNIVNNVCSMGAGQNVRHGAIAIGNVEGGERSCPQGNYVLRNNIITNMTSGNVVCTEYQLSNLQADGNVYDTGNLKFVWGGNTDCGSGGSGKIGLDVWRDGSHAKEGAATKQCAPSFMAAATGDFRLSPSDGCARDAGVDVSSITTFDIDGHTRPAGRAFDVGASEVSGVSAPVLLDVVPVQ